MDDLISEFITETTDSLSMLDQELVKLEQNPENDTILANIFRIVHTIKGPCGFLGLPRLESVAHASENVLEKIREKECEATPYAIALVLESLDCIKTLIDYLSDNGQEPEGNDADLIARLDHYADTGQIKRSDSCNLDVSARADEALDMTLLFKEEDDDHNTLIEAKKTQGSVASHATQEKVVAIKEAIEAMVREIPKAVAIKPVPKPAPIVKSENETPTTSSSGGDASSIRINLDVLENLMQMVSELVLTRNQLMQVAHTREDHDFLAPLQHLSHITSELQGTVMKTRMQPIGNAWSKFPRLIRDLSLELNKKIELKMVGEETELDHQLLEMIKDSLTYIVRNSCDHGLEAPADRRAAGKNENGTITLSASHEGGYIIIKITDDGRGINMAKIKEKIISSVLASESDLESLSDQQIMQYIFHPGFSAADKMFLVSGRGLGMDVVKANIKKMGGTVELDSVYGKGSEFSIKIPLTFAIISVLIVEACGERFAIPQLNVTELVCVGKPSGHVVEMINKAPVIRLREKLLPLVELGNVLGLHEDDMDWSARDAFVVVCRIGGTDFGVIVDRVFDTEEIVVKPVAEILKSISLYSGNTILGDGSVIMILDTNGLARTLGDVVVAKDDQDGAQRDKGEKLIGFLLFSIGRGAPKAVPLEMVSRLEEIEVTKIEIAGDEPVVQYHGDLMRLVSLPGSDALPIEGLAQIVVFTYDNRTVGLVVSQILDIAYAPFDVKLQSKEKEYLGSMVIHDKTTDVVDVSQLLISTLGESETAEDAPVEVAVQSNDDEAIVYNILLVEDSPFFRNLTVPFLAAAGHKITAADSGHEALKAIGTDPNHFDLIITDIEMPGMNGFEFATACRSLPGFVDTPIIAYSASLSEEVMRRGKSVGIDDCILKTDRPGLLQAVSRCLSELKGVAA